MSNKPRTRARNDQQNAMHGEWTQRAMRETKNRPLSNLTSETLEGIDIKPLYTQKDIENNPYLQQIPGAPPFMRGIRATMYSGRAWTIRQYAGFSTAEDSNAFYRAALAAGQQGVSVAFDLATHRGYDSDHPRVAGDVGKAGVAIDSINDMQTLFAGIDLDKISVSMTMNGAVLPVLAAFIVTGMEQGVKQENLSGTIQNDILKEFMVRNTYIYPPEPSLRIVTDVIEYTAQYMPKFNSLSISGYHMQEAGADLIQELAFTLADGREYVRAAVARGLDVDAFAGRLSFFFAMGADFFMEICKLRAARVLWHRIMLEFNPRLERSLMLRTHCQTSGVSLQGQDPHNNVVRTAYQALSAVLGGTQSLHTNAFDEAIALPSNAAARLARNTQLILQEETGVTRVVDPLAGSYYVETLTKTMIDKAWAVLEEIEKMGGMTQAIIKGLPKQRIEETATRRQASIDRGDSVLVGVNKYQVDNESPVDVRAIDNVAVRTGQVEKLRTLRATRDERVCQTALRNLQQAARTNGNLLAHSIDAIRARATVGEISSALEAVFGRYQARINTLSGVYKDSYKKNDTASGALKHIQDIIVDFTTREGQRPRLFVAKLGQDGHDRGAKVIATAFSDMGFDVNVGPLFQTPIEAAQDAIDNNAHVIGVSSQAAGHMTLVPELIATLKAKYADNILVVCGGVIPEQDHAFLYEQGVSAIFGTGTNIPQAARKIVDLIEKRAGRMRNFQPDDEGG